MKNNLDNLSNFIFYQTDDGKISVQVFVDNESETIWASQKAMSEIFDINVSGITKHLKNIFEENELSETGNVQKLHIANSTKPVNFYSLDVIISVGYRINYPEASLEVLVNPIA